MDKKICSVPWKEVWVNPELKYGLCCKENQVLVDHSDSQKITLEQHWRKPFMIDVRQRFINGEPVPECDLCWGQERNGKQSMRMRRNLRYLGNTEATEADLSMLKDYTESDELIEGLNLSVGNQCQLRCITCNPSYSRNIKKDYEKLNWSIHQKSRFDTANSSDSSHHLSYSNIDEIKKITPRLKWIALVGGEPTLDQKLKSYLQWCVDNKHSQHLSLVITTNGVNVKSEFIDIIQNFQKVVLTVSVDGYGELDEYLRWPGRWDKKLQFIDQCQSLFSDFDIHSVVYGLNCLAIDRLIDFVHSKGIKHNLECLQWPSSLSIDNMPLDHKIIARDRLTQSLENIEKNLDNYPDVSHGHHTINSIRAVISQLEQPGSPGSWSQTQSIIDAYDTIRSKKLAEIIPDLLAQHG